MKKAKLFMMLALLVMGVTSSWAQTTYKYRVLFESGVIPGGYTVNTGQSRVTAEEDGSVLTSTTTLSHNSTSSRYIGKFITPKEVVGNTSSFYVEDDNEMGYQGIVYINYNADGSIPENKWNDGTFWYSNYYTRDSNDKICLSGNQVAISLYMGETISVEKDTVIMNNNTPTGNYSDLGNHYAGPSVGTRQHFYEWNHEVQGSTIKNVVIPATVTAPTENGGGTYNVTAIQKWGFAYEQGHVLPISYRRSVGSTCEEAHYWCHDDHSNRYLETVNFASNTNIKSIGDYAFMSCTKLHTINLPSSLEYLGQGIFEQCEALKNCNFQNNTTKVECLRFFTFWLCVSMKTLELPEGIKMIEGKGGGAALQYMINLTNLKLPNTLKEVGPHFLCCARSLKQLTIPASVKYLDAACFHGCEKLESVYLLGRAASLQGGSSNGTTFAANSTLCVDAVSNCTFYTTEDYVQSYAAHDVWCWIADNHDPDGSLYYIDEDGQKVYITNSDGDIVKISGSSNNRNNRLIVIPEEKRTFTGGRWVTAIFNNPISYVNDNNETLEGLENVFGANTRVATMTGATTTIGTDPITKEAIRIYALTFTLIDHDDFSTDVPYMFCPENTVEDYVMITQANMADDAFKAEMTVDHAYSVYSDKNDGEVIMKGYYSSWPLIPWDFYFSYNGNTAANAKAMFYRVGEPNTVTSLPSRCYWTVNVNGYRSQAGAKAANQRFFDETTGIDDIKTKVVIEGIYDLNGRKLDVNPQDLPKGLFIINGKKVMMK